MDNRGAQAIRQELERRKGLKPSQGQKELADDLGMSQSFLSRLASGEKTPKLLEDGLALKRVLNIEPEWFDQEPCSEEPAA